MKIAWILMIRQLIRCLIRTVAVLQCANRFTKSYGSGLLRKRQNVTYDLKKTIGVCLAEVDNKQRPYAKKTT